MDSQFDFDANVEEDAGITWTSSGQGLVTFYERSSLYRQTPIAFMQLPASTTDIMKSLARGKMPELGLTPDQIKLTNFLAEQLNIYYQRIRLND